MKYYASLFTAIAVLSIFSGCKDDDPGTGKINFYFEERVGDSALVVDSVKYTNTAGNEYMITEIQYFISNVKLCYQDGATYEIKDDNGIHYRDTDIPETKNWMISDEVPAGTLDSIVFTFGLDEETNVNGLFPNQPESNMFWPDALGGGYHYMKLNGKWIDVNSFLSPFHFHLGIGQTYDTLGNITGFVQNSFKVTVYMQVWSSYVPVITAGETTNLSLVMDIDSWFQTPNTWDFDQWGGMMMQNQDAMHAACENGFDVFTIKPLLELQ